MPSEQSHVDPKQVVADGYDQVAHAYALLEGEAKWPRMRWLGKLLHQLEPGSSVLDLGCGSGEPAAVAIAKAHQITGVDISQTQIDLARGNVPTGVFLRGDAGSVDFPDASFDAVISFYTLEHLPRAEHETVLARIHRWLRPGGYLLISIEAGDLDNVMGEWLGVPMFLSCFDPDTMRQMVTGLGFVILESAVEGQTEQGSEVPYLWLFATKPR